MCITHLLNKIIAIRKYYQNAEVSLVSTFRSLGTKVWMHLLLYQQTEFQFNITLQGIKMYMIRFNLMQFQFAFPKCACSSQLVLVIHHLLY